MNAFRIIAAMDTPDENDDTIMIEVSSKKLNLQILHILFVWFYFKIKWVGGSFGSTDNKFLYQY